jgi:hypothetical protein
MTRNSIDSWEDFKPTSQYFALVVLVYKDSGKSWSGRRRQVASDAVETRWMESHHENRQENGRLQKHEKRVKRRCEHRRRALTRTEGNEQPEQKRD